MKYLGGGQDEDLTIVGQLTGRQGQTYSPVVSYLGISPRPIVKIQLPKLVNV
jgi:hypothetical protein